MTRPPPLLLCLLALAGCGQRGREGPAPVRVAEEPYRGAWSPRPQAAAAVVAEVNGEPIWDAEVAAYAAAHAVSARAALDALVDLELLAQEARRRGLAEDADVVEVRRRERVRRLIDGFAAETATPDRIPAGDVDKVWSRPDVQRALNHGEQHVVVYVRVPITRKDPPGWEEEARQHAEAVRARLARAKLAGYEDVQREANDFYRARTGGKRLGSEKPLVVDAEANFIPVFKAAALALKKPGQVSPVTRTPWGWDILYLLELVPPRATTRADADADLRRRVHQDWRRYTFARWLEAFVKAARIERDDQGLAGVEVDSTFGLP